MNEVLLEKRINRRLAQQYQQKENSHSDHQMDPAGLSEPDSDHEDQEIVFSHRVPDEEVRPSSPAKVQAVLDCEITNMVRTLNGAIAALSQDTARIQRAYHQLAENIARDKALADLTIMVREHGSSPAAIQPYGPPTPAARPRPAMQADVLDGDGNLRAADNIPAWRQGGRTKILMTDRTGTGYVHTLSTEKRQ